LADDRVKQVKDANDIVDVVGSYLSLRPLGSTFKGLCPFHDDHRPSFDVDPNRQRYRCWSCGKFGDVLSFVMEFDKVSFPEALELLARRAGITLDRSAGPGPDTSKARLLDVVRWAAQQYHTCLLDSPLAEAARVYLGQRGFKGETVRKYGLGYAPLDGNWLVQRAETAQVPFDLLEAVGLIAPSRQGPGYYDRFRDRVQFPIRDVRGQAIAFGGRILPGSALADRAPKYYNSCDTPLFTKSDCLYGLDQARHAAETAGYLAIVEGYTDVLMAHQAGVLPVVATMGTALNERHVRQLRRFAGRVVLVFDADEGGETGVDRALTIFASQDVDLAIATLPAGLDPCDLIRRDGAEAFQKALTEAVGALDFKLQRVLASPEASSVEGRRRAVESVLSVIALAPELPGEAGSVKTQLMLGRMAQRLALREETLWARLDELRRARRERGSRVAATPEPAPVERRARAPAEERQLLEVLLADETLVARAATEVLPDELTHPGLGRLLAGLYALHAAGEPPTLDLLRARLDGDPLLPYALEMQDIGRRHPDRSAWLDQLLKIFRERRQRPAKQELHNQLHAASDHALALELLRQLQNRPGEIGPDTTPGFGS
jgi:DNA primase